VEAGGIMMRDGQIIMLDDDRMPLYPGEAPELVPVRFRTCGCYPLMGGSVSNARSVGDVIVEVLSASGSERQGRIIDKDGSSQMEHKKRQGCF
jgi:sulfate adenylyltransferase subunit 2